MTTMTDPNTTTPRRITIPLSDAPPVSVDPADWPVIAATDTSIETDGTSSWIKVRRHNDGRTLVHGRRTKRRINADDGRVQIADAAGGGFLLEPTGDVVRAIRRVAGMLRLTRGIESLIASLPAVEL